MYTSSQVVHVVSPTFFLEKKNRAKITRFALLSLHFMLSFLDFVFFFFFSFFPSVFILSGVIVSAQLIIFIPLIDVEDSAISKKTVNYLNEKSSLKVIYLECCEL